MREFVGEGFDGTSRPRIDLPTGVGLQLQEQLGVARDAGAEVRGEGEGFVEGVGVEALRMTMRGGHRLDAGPDRIVHDVLGGQGPARGLRCQAEDLGLLGENSDTSRSEVTGTQLATSMKKFMPTPQKLIRGANASTSIPGPRPSDVLDAIRERVRQFDVRRRSGLLHVVLADADAVEPGQPGGSVGEDVADDAQVCPGDGCRCSGP